MRQLKNSFIPLFILLVSSNSATANRAGVTGYSGNPSDINAGLTCTTATGCHSVSVGAIPPAVVIQGPVTVVVNSTNTYKLIMTRQDNLVAINDRIGGVDISVDSGFLFKRDLGTQAIPIVAGVSSEITHIILSNLKPKTVMADGKTLTWLFEWTAPSVAPAQAINLYASLLSGNNDKLESGDSTRSVSLAVKVVPSLNVIQGVPKAIIRAPFTVQVGSPISFSASESKVSGGRGFIEKYKWTFSDRATSLFNSEQISRTFITTGPVTANLTVTATADNGLKIYSNTTFLDFTVIAKGDSANDVPVARISAPKTTTTGTVVTFDASASTPIRAKRYLWDFGDPNDRTIGESISGSSTITHTYTVAKDYTVTLAVQSLDGLTNIETFVIKITDGTVGVLNVVAGGQLFNNTDTNQINTNCTGAACHGNAGIANGIVKNIQGATQQLIDNSIANVNNVPALMVTRINNIKNIDPAGTGKVADYLGNVVIPTNLVLDAFDKGKLLYETRCLICHGINADGVPPSGIPVRGLNIMGATQTLIRNAINQVISPGRVAIPLMQGIQLSNTEASYIETYLQLPVGAVGRVLDGAFLFVSKCQFCHGPGSGGLARSVENTTLTIIDTKIANISMMNNIILTAQEKIDILAYLSSGQLSPQPTTGMELYDMYCSYCHGFDGQGGMVAEKSIAGTSFTGQDIMDLYSPGGNETMVDTNLGNVGFSVNGAILDLNLIALYISQLNKEGQ